MIFSRVLLFALALFGALLSTGAHASESDVRRVWQLLDYLSVDYGGAVENGKVKSESEFGEMREFAATARAKIAALDATDGRIGPDPMTASF